MFGKADPMNQPDEYAQSFGFDSDFEPSLSPSVTPPGTPGSLSLPEWDEEFRSERPGLASDPLTATFTDLDLSEVRTRLLPAEFDTFDWSE
jgi:hypothetical protein